MQMLSPSAVAALAPSACACVWARCCYSNKEKQTFVGGKKHPLMIKVHLARAFRSSGVNTASADTRHFTHHSRAVVIRARLF